MKRILGIWVLLVGLLPLACDAQYQLIEMAVHGGVGVRTLVGTTGALPGPGAHLSYSYTYIPCGKAFGFEGRAGLAFGMSGLADGNVFLDLATAGKTSIGWAGPEIAGAFKVRLHEKHRPKEMAFVFGPKLSFPLLAWYGAEDGKGGIPNDAVSLNRIAPVGFFALQFRRPAPDKKSWFFEPGFEFMPSALFRRDADFQYRALYVYVQFGFAFWDQRG